MKNSASHLRKDRWTSARGQNLKFSKIREILAKVQTANRQGAPVIDFSIGRPDFDTPDHIKQAATKALSNGFVHYTSSLGIKELREAISSRFLKDHQTKIGTDNILVTNGATEALLIGLQSIIDPGDEIIVPQPGYTNYEGWSRLCGAKFVSYPLEKGSFLFKTDKLADYITPRTKAIILNSPHNPTGQVFDKDELIKLTKAAIEHDFLIIWDDIYHSFIYDNIESFTIADLRKVLDRTLIIGSFSKIYAMDGWRIGYLIAPPEIINSAHKIHQLTVSCVNSFVQKGAAAAMADSQECVTGMVQEFDRRRKLMMSWLDTMGLPYIQPKGAFYIFPEIKKFGLTSMEFANFLIEKAKVAVIPGDAFGPMGEGHIRLSYSTSRENIDKGMQQIQNALEYL